MRQSHVRYLNDITPPPCPLEEYWAAVLFVVWFDGYEENNRTALRGRNHNKKSPPQEVSCLLPTEGLYGCFLLFFYFTSPRGYFFPACF
jgi:hypothetical protein